MFYSQMDFALKGVLYQFSEKTEALRLKGEPFTSFEKRRTIQSQLLRLERQYKMQQLL